MVAHNTEVHNPVLTLLSLQILEYFHQHKKQRGVDEALLRLYQPIIWRAFKVRVHEDPGAFFLNTDY